MTKADAKKIEAARVALRELKDYYGVEEYRYIDGRRIESKLQEVAALLPEGNNAIRILNAYGARICSYWGDFDEQEFSDDLSSIDLDSTRTLDEDAEAFGIYLCCYNDFGDIHESDCDNYATDIATRVQAYREHWAIKAVPDDEVLTRIHGNDHD